MPTILDEIIERKRDEIKERSAQVNVTELLNRHKHVTPTRGFVSALQAQVSKGRAAVIAEIKKASPSKGVIRELFNPEEIASSYASYGATCLSVLTDVDFFMGKDEYLQAARSVCELPVLRKDFFIDSYQIIEARSIGADCILLIASVLDKNQLLDLSAVADDLNMDVLVEVHDQQELDIALSLGLKLIGINNRDLKTFTTSLDNTINLLPSIPDDCLVVTESGIHSKADVDRMLENKVRSFLVGEAFMREDNPGQKLQDLFGHCL